MLSEQLLSEQFPEIPLTERETQLFAMAEECLRNGNAAEGKQELIDFITDTGTKINLVKAGSNPNVGSFYRNGWVPNGEISLMDTPAVSEEQKVYELVHEYMYLQLHCLALPDVQGIKDIEKSAVIFASGLPARVAADIRLAQALPDERMRESITTERTELLEKLQNPEYTLKKSREFITLH